MHSSYILGMLRFSPFLGFELGSSPRQLAASLLVIISIFLAVSWVNNLKPVNPQASPPIDWPGECAVG